MDSNEYSRLQAGDQEAFQSLYAAHAKRIWAYFRRSGFSAADADDLTQDAFLRAYKSIGTFDPGRGRPGTWLGTIARNVTRRCWSKAPAGEDFDPQLAEAVLEDSPQDDALETAEALDGLEDCIGQLPDELGALIRLRYIDGMTTRGMASKTGMPESTIRHHLMQAWEKLEKCMKNKGFLDQE